ncbi:MAG: AAA family ATPase [Inconstantimicrobium porci]|uniref:AAA family ATPase n=1 Tax=Inconstantimicrobium porci TaxID=2652291 RepID=UPI002A91C41D|nr:AAA family ATPase [Inconstantimicrobium porci]MDY5912537.1 AAA family ATPase [Inconstantimicrobium porci]
MKIHIIGCSGTGKSYLAEGLAKKYSIDHYDLDDLMWDTAADTYGVRMDKEKRNKLLQEIVNKDNWVIEGVYYGWVQESFKRADRVYVLEIPKHVYKYRIIKRFIKRKLGLQNGKKETFKSLRDLLKWTDDFQNMNMKEIKQILEQYKDKVYYIKSSREVQMILNK